MLEKINQGIAPDGKPFNIFTLSLDNISIQVMDWGATWLSYKVKIEENYREILLGCLPNNYDKQSVYMGATIGRYANRIANSQFEINGKSYLLNANQDQHQLHGGPKGFDKIRWNIEKCGENFIQFSHFSINGEQGFPGNVKVFVTYILEKNGIKIEFNAESDQDTPLNLTNHAYFNLDNAEQGTDIRHHKLQLSADYFLPVDSQGIPNAPLKLVKNTSFDFNQEKLIGQDFLKEEQTITKGYDHSFLLAKNHEQPSVKLTSSDEKISLCIKTSQPAIQIYTGNYLEGTINRIGKHYYDYSGIALETQALPDTPNHPEWYKFGGIIKANEKYHHWTSYQIFIK
ncbi:aldose 1-epimerase [Bisgaardia hudsonensis]|uniref:Aldose 1-epimerase n=1 Tax=Bisgaardia hudsonensis TaxID=109472 RepID=A0A4R2N2Y6_9PAST|nr:galactose-1-epimerase [Bisgaardia hudsonensis]QLB12689.1 galactose-1-epimerase [Bisgaardia hudsonensis]TCP14238.1 aldose 1-epimerase [Bisgaardia hudsonensis]